MQPLRVKILGALVEPAVCADLAHSFDSTPQCINNHLKVLQSAHLIEVVAQKPKRHLIEKTYRAVAKSFWLSQGLTRVMGEDHQKIREQLSLHNLLKMSEQLQEDAAALLGTAHGVEVPSIGVCAEVQLRSEEERSRFTRDYLRLMHGLLERYQGTGGREHRYKAMLVCYPDFQKDISKRSSNE